MSEHELPITSAGTHNWLGLFLCSAAVTLCIVSFVLALVLIDRRLNQRSSFYHVELTNDNENEHELISRNESVSPFRLAAFSNPVYSNNNCYSDPILFYLPSWRDQFYRVQKCYSDSYRNQLPPLAAKVLASESYYSLVIFSVEILILIILSITMLELFGHMVLTCVSTLGH